MGRQAPPARRGIGVVEKQHLNSVATRRAKSTSRIARCGQTIGRPMPPVRNQGQPRRGKGSVGLTLEGLEVGPPRPRLSPSTEGVGEASPACQAGYWGGRKTAFKQRCNAPSKEYLPHRPMRTDNREAVASRKKPRPTPKGHRLRWPYLRRSRGRAAPASIKPLHGGGWGGKPRLPGGVLGWSKNSI